MIIVDTDIVIDFLRQHPPAVVWISSVTEPVCLPGIVAMELYQGCQNRREVQELRRQIQPFAVLWPDEAAANAALANFMSSRLTHAVGILDELIAATALTHQLPLHTFNTKHFAAIPGLKIIQPYAR